MLIKRTAMWLFAWGALILLGPPSMAQVPANSNLNYQTPTPSYENAGAPFSEATPRFGRMFSPFHPMSFEPTAQPFAPADTSGYGNGPRANIGYFGSFERVFWSLSKPSTAAIGSPTATGSRINPLFPFRDIIGGVPNTIISTNSVDTGGMEANGAWGNRIELGYVDTDNHGWLVSILDHVSQGQMQHAVNPQIQFDDPGHLLDGFISTTVATIFGTSQQPLDLGKVPTGITNLAMKNILTLNGVEVMAFYRAPRLHDGGYFELLYGPRWLQMADTFSVTGLNTSTTTPGIVPISVGGVGNILSPMTNSLWNTRAQNNLIGPEIGGRWFSQRGRWVTSIEARFLAAANFQSVQQTTSLGDNAFQSLNTALTAGAIGNLILPGPTPETFAALVAPGTINFTGVGSNTHMFATTFSPVGELRVATAYQVTSSVALKLGYTGIVMGNITRASNRIDYSGPNLISILPTGTHQLFFANGINFGVEVNR
jgi:hypothetical protein